MKWSLYHCLDMLVYSLHSKTFQRFQMVMMLLPAWLHSAISTFGTNHICTGNKTEPAGVSGTVYVEADCHLTLTGITGKTNVQGISFSSCEGGRQLYLDGENYCADEDVLDTVITVSGDKLAIKTEQSNNCTIRFYHGKNYCLLSQWCSGTAEFYHSWIKILYQQPESCEPLTSELFYS